MFVCGLSLHMWSLASAHPTKGEWKNPYFKWEHHSVSWIFNFAPWWDHYSVNDGWQRAATAWCRFWTMVGEPIYFTLPQFKFCQWEEKGMECSKTCNGSDWSWNQYKSFTWMLNFKWFLVRQIQSVWCFLKCKKALNTNIIVHLPYNCLCVWTEMSLDHSIILKLTTLGNQVTKHALKMCKGCEDWMNSKHF